MGSRSPDLDDAQGQYLSRRVLVGIGSKANPALLDGLPSLIKGVSQDCHLVGVEGSSKRVLYQIPEARAAFPSTRKIRAATLTRIDDVLKKVGFGLSRDYGAALPQVASSGPSGRLGGAGIRPPAPGRASKTQFWG